MTAVDGDAAGAVRDTGAVLKYHHTLGARVAPGRTVEHLGDDTVMYLAGKHVAAFQWENPQHRFILKNPKTSEIVTFCVSANRKYIALAERLVEGALQVNIYTQHTGSKVRSLEFKYLSKLPVVSMCFSTDNKYLATVTAVPDAYLYLWQVDKSRLIGMVDVPFEVTRVTVSPWAYWTLATTGPSSLKLWKLVDKQLRHSDVLPKRKDASQGVTAQHSFRFTCHAWYDEDKLVAGTEEGDLLVVEHGETKRILRAVHGEGMAVTTVQAVSRGLLCGGDGGIISLFERSFDESTYFRQLRRFPPICTARVVDLSVSPKEDNAMAVYRNNTMALLALEHVDSATIKDNDPATFASSMPIGFHDDDVTAIDVCVQKPIIVTGSLDKTVRVWNFLRRKVEFVKTFEEEVLSLALHPTGLRLVVGFRNYMRMYNVLANDLHFATELPLKNCTEVKFSHGGHAFAAVIAHRVLIFNAYDFQCTVQLSGHSGIIHSIAWSQNDLYLTVGDMNGLYYRWQVENQKRDDTDDSRKAFLSYSCVRTDDANNMIAAYATCKVAEPGMAEGDITIRCIVPGHEPRVVRPGFTSAKLPSQRKHHTAELAISPLAQTLFVGTPAGSLLLYRWPLTDDATPYQTIEVHASEITFVQLSEDERYLFTVGEDRACYMFDVDAMADGRSVTRKPFNYAAFEDVCYVLQSDMDDKLREISQLQVERDELEAARQRDTQALKQKYEVERATREEESQAQVDFLSRQLEQAQKSKDDTEKTLTDNASQLERMHLKAAEELEALYTKRSDEANQRYQTLKVERDDLVVRYENRIFKISKEQESEKRRLEEKLAELEGKMNAELQGLRSKSAESVADGEKMLDQTIVDYETLIDEVTLRHKQELTKTEEELARAINSGSTGERDSDRLRKEKVALQSQLADKDKRIDELEAGVDKKRKEYESLNKEMNVRKESIDTATKKIQRLKKQTSELEKLRYVLTFKFNELKKEVAPKEKQIGFLSTRVEEMDHELEKVALDREGLKQALDRKEERLQVLQREIQSEKNFLEDKERVVNTLLRELTDVIGANDQKRMVHQLKAIVTKYGTKKQRAESLGEEDRTAEFERQREYMESQLGCIKRQNRQKESNLRLENQRSTAENAILVKEINELRHEKKQLVTKCSMVESQLKEARLALQRAATTPAPSPPGASVATPVPPARSAAAAVRGPTPDDSASTRRGRVLRGPTRALRDVSQLDSDKLARIIAQVERNNSEMERQQDEIGRLRDFVAHLLSRAEADASLTPDEKDRHAEIRTHLAQAAGAPAAP